jgi:hypothetical protein
MKIKQLAAAGAIVVATALPSVAQANQYCVPVGAPPPDPGGRICTPDLPTDPNGFLHAVLCLASDNC